MATGVYAVRNPKYVTPENPTGTVYRRETEKGFQTFKSSDTSKAPIEKVTGSRSISEGNVSKEVLTETYNVQPTTTTITEQKTINTTQAAKDLVAKNFPTKDPNTIVREGFEKSKFSVPRTPSVQETITRDVSINRINVNPAETVRESLAAREESLIQERKTGSNLKIESELLVGGLGRGALFAIDPYQQYAGIKSVVTQPKETLRFTLESAKRNPSGFVGEFIGASAVGTLTGAGFRNVKVQVKPYVEPYIKFKPIDIRLGTAEALGEKALTPKERAFAFRPKLEKVEPNVFTKSNIIPTDFGNVEIITTEKVGEVSTQVKNRKIIDTDFGTIEIIKKTDDVSKPKAQSNIIDKVPEEKSLATLGTGSSNQIDFSKLNLNQKSQSFDPKNPFLLDKGMSLNSKSPISLDFDAGTQTVILEEAVSTPKTIYDLTSISAIKTQQGLSFKPLIIPKTSVASVRVQAQSNRLLLNSRTRLDSVTNLQQKNVFKLDVRTFNIQRIKTTPQLRQNLIQETQLKNAVESKQISQLKLLNKQELKFINPFKPSKEIKATFKGIKSKGFGVKFGYTPSVEAQLFNIKGTPSKLAFTGLATRPIQVK